LFPNVW